MDISTRTILSGEPLDKFLKHLGRSSNFIINVKNPDVVEMFDSLHPSERNEFHNSLQKTGADFFAALEKEMRKNIPDLSQGINFDAITNLIYSEADMAQSFFARQLGLVYEDGHLTNSDRNNDVSATALAMFTASEPLQHIHLLFMQFLNYQKVGKSYFPLMAMQIAFGWFSEPGFKPIDPNIERYIATSLGHARHTDDFKLAYKLEAYLIAGRIGGAQDMLEVILDSAEILCGKRPSPIQMGHVFEDFITEQKPRRDIGDNEVEAALFKAIEARHGNAMVIKVKRKFDERLQAKSKELDVRMPDGKN